ncbi:hypothetical protein PAV_1c03610 [Paenibacillus alvei DSM 29]|nr:hypothetical protein PAV_1c03610 [Paenibacillus alvei DSM 29]
MTIFRFFCDLYDEAYWDNVGYKEKITDKIKNVAKLMALFLFLRSSNLTKKMSEIKRKNQENCRLLFPVTETTVNTIAPKVTINSKER